MHKIIIWPIGVWTKVLPSWADNPCYNPSNKQAGLVSGKQKTIIKYWAIVVRSYSVVLRNNAPWEALNICKPLESRPRFWRENLNLKSISRLFCVWKDFYRKKVKEKRNKKGVDIHTLKIPCVPVYVCMFSTADLEIKNVPNPLRWYHLSAICPEDI